MPPASEFRKEDLMKMEKEMLGIYLTAHPLKEVEDVVKKVTTVDTEILANPEKCVNIKNNSSATMAGLITGVKKMITKKGGQMAYLTIEDLYGQIEVVVFPKCFDNYRQNMEVDNVVVIKGKLDLKEEGNPKLMADSVVLLSDLDTKIKMLKIVIPENYSEADGLGTFRKIAKRHLGDMPVALLVKSTGHKYRLDYDLWVDPDEEFMTELKDAFGDDCLR
jgi:DNA polymerase-3 subunit alpha